VKKPIFIYTILTLFIILFSIYFIKTQDKINTPEITLLKSFDSSGARIVSAEAYLWGRLDEKKLQSFKELEEFAAGFARELGIEGSNIVSSKAVENDAIKEVEINGVIAQNKMINISAQMKKTGKSSEGEKYISVSFMQDLSGDGLEEARNQILGVFKKHNITPKINSCITGNYEGKLDYTQMNDICKKVFNEAAARKVEGMRDGNFISISAYSPVINNYIRVEQNKVNLNVAIRYNSYEDKTYIWLATPVITTEY
jgi:hypothetical protein